MFLFFISLIDNTQLQKADVDLYMLYVRKLEIMIHHGLPCLDTDDNVHENKSTSDNVKMTSKPGNKAIVSFKAWYNFFLCKRIGNFFLSLFCIHM